MKIEHIKTFAPFKIVLESKNECKTLCAIVGELTDGDVIRLCKREKMDHDKAKLACKMIDQLYDMLSKAINE